MSVPGPPNIYIRPQATVNSVTLYWELPLNIGDITNYTVTCAQASYSQSVSTSVNVLTIPSLSTGIDYYFQITANNAQGSSIAAAFEPVQVGLPPAGATTVLASTLNASSAVVNWSFSTNTGEAPTRWFVLSAIPSTIGSAPIIYQSAYFHERTRIMYNLQTGITYNLLVQAVNDVHYAPPTALSNPITMPAPRPTTWVPTNFPNLTLWVDASDPNNNSSTLENNADVSTWYDKSGNGNNLTTQNPLNSNVTGLPIYTTNTINSLPVINFNVTQAGLISQPLNIAVNATILFVYIPTSNVTNQATYFGVWQGTNHDSYINIRRPGGNSIGIDTFGDNCQITVNYDLPSLISVTVNGGANLFIQQINSSGVVTNSYNNNSYFTTTTGRIWLGHDDGNGESKANFGEIIYYQRLLTTEQRQVAEGYLAWKWGLNTSLPSNHPYKNNAPSPNTVITNWSPNSLYGLTLWLDGADPAGTGHLTAGGTSLTTWTDKSGTSHNATQSTQGNRPVTLMNGGVYFSASASNRMVFNTPVPLLNTMTCFFVTSASSAGGNSVLYDTSDGNNAIHFNYSAPIQQYNVSSSDGDFIGTTPPSVNLYNYTLVENTSNVGYYMGSQVFNYSSVTTTANTMTYLGSLSNSTNYFDGVVYEMLIYNYALSTAERQVVEGYLAWKWQTQFSLPSNHPFYNDAPAINVLAPILILKAKDYSGSGTWLDASGKNNNATKENGTIAKNTAGNGIVFDGSTSWTLSTLYITNAWSVNIWFKKTGSTLGGLITQNFSGSINVNIGDWGNGGYQGALFDGGQHLGTVFNVTNNAWTNIQVTWDGANMNTYINGTLLGSTQPGGGATDNGGVLRLGQGFGGDYTVGEIGEVRIYNYAISPGQVTADYNSSLGDY